LSFLLCLFLVGFCRLIILARALSHFLVGVNAGSIGASTRAVLAIGWPKDGLIVASSASHRPTEPPVRVIG
jgi:hypothetical protein